MFDSFASYVLMAVAAVTLLAAILWLKKRKLGVKGGGMTKEAEVVTDVPETVLAVEEVLATPKKRVKRVGVLTIDMTDVQVCEKCRLVWVGELIRSGKCGKCGGRLLVLVAEGAPQQYVVVSQYRLNRLCWKLWGLDKVFSD